MAVVRESDFAKLEYSQRLRQADDKFQTSQYLIKRAQVRQIMRSHALIESGLQTFMPEVLVHIRPVPNTVIWF
jgi:hypothetical protein